VLLTRCPSKWWKRKSKEMNNKKKNLSELEEEALRNYIRELMTNDLGEHDALYSKPKQWKDEVSDLRTDMTQLLQHIEDDEYQDGVENIDRVSAKLITWKKKIQKYLN
jgi:hemerythrin superfamily protein